MKEKKNKGGKGIVILLLIIVFALTAALGYVLYEIYFGDAFKPEEETKIPEKKIVSSEYINEKLQGMGELVTQKMTYTGLYTVTEGSIPFITQKGFSMVYVAEIDARIDFEQIEFISDENGISFVIPHATLGEPHIDPSSIEFFDEKKSIFNWQHKKDVIDAQAAAEEDVLSKYDFSDMLELADKHAVLLLTSLFRSEDTPVTVTFK